VGRKLKIAVCPFGSHSLRPAVGETTEATLDGFNDRDSLEYKFWTLKFILQSACLKSLCPKTDIFVTIPGTVTTKYSDSLHIY